LPGGKIKELRFQAFENEVLKKVRENRNVGDIATDLAVNYKLGKAECTQKCNLILEKFIKDGIIVSKDSKMNIVQKVFKKPVK
jgi:hypothetical protein